MNCINLLIITFMVVFVSAAHLFAQDEDKDWSISKSYFEREWEHNEEESLAKIPADLREELIKIKEIDVEQYGELLHDAVHASYDAHFEYMEAFERERYETDLLVQKLEVQTEVLGIQYEHAKDDQKNGIISKLKTTLEKLFEMKEKERSLNIEMLEKELARLKESVSVRQQHKKDIINRRLNELIGRDDYFEW